MLEPELHGKVAAAAMATGTINDFINQALTNELTHSTAVR